MAVPRVYARVVKKASLSFVFCMLLLLSIAAYSRRHSALVSSHSDASLLVSSSLGVMSEQFTSSVPSSFSSVPSNSSLSSSAPPLFVVAPISNPKMAVHRKREFDEGKQETKTTQDQRKRDAPRNIPHSTSTQLNGEREEGGAIRRSDPSSASIPAANLKNRTKLVLETTRKSKYLWPGDAQCSQFKVNFAAAASLSPCALASYPGSGNTWTRYLLEAASGVFTGSIYRDHQLYLHGYYGELDDHAAGTTIAQKTHDCGPTHVKAFRGTAVLLLRNPYRAILSFHNYLFGGHTGYAPLANYRRKDWGAFVKLQAKAWLEMAVNWTTQAEAGRLRVLHYEELKEDPIPLLEDVLRFRGLDVDPLRLKCLKSHANQKFKRREEFVMAGLEIFSHEDRDKIDRAIRYVDYLLKLHNQRPVPLHLYEFYNGTDSSKMTVVPCKEGETKLQCENRVDMMNKYNRKATKKGSEEKEKTGLERFVKTKVGGAVTGVFSSLLKIFSQDPLDATLQDPSNLKPLHLQQVAGAPVDARQLVMDFDPVKSIAKRGR
ncbi:uncharacterized protein LOC125027303 [Penaeus chinensis]|uniref:uncharacterized protein LOC125027303 n=1 Tax=Penaeus chinensis TaxID=139456 RepID=UPI001FB7DB2B|nr:uncharacterized protein LOC125027303 [Penaeus chinensis]